MGNKSKNKTRKIPDSAEQPRPLPSDLQTLRRMIADLHAFLELLKAARDRGDFEWIGQVFEHLEHHVAPGNSPCAEITPRGLKLKLGLLMALQSLDAKDVANRVSAMKTSLNAWQAETEKPAGRHPILVRSTAQKSPLQSHGSQDRVQKNLNQPRPECNRPRGCTTPCAPAKDSEKACEGRAHVQGDDSPDS